MTTERFYWVGLGGVILVRGPGEPSFSRAKNPDRQVISGMAQLGDGNILVAGLGGVRKVNDSGYAFGSPF